jgi:hypothetical protein
MSDPDRAQADEADDELEEYEEEPRNPFDNPYFLPVLLAGFALWCGWDGFISDKFLERPNTLWFNRIAFLVLGSISAWMTVRARRETSAAKSKDSQPN